MSEFTAVFDKHNLSTLFTVSPIERTLTAWEPTMVDAVVGSTFTGTKTQPMEIKLQLTTLAKTLQERLADLRTLSEWLAVDEPKPLVLTDERLAHVWIENTNSWLDFYELRDAVPSGAPRITHTMDSSTAEVTFICPNPIAYRTTADFFLTLESGAAEIDDDRDSVGQSIYALSTVTVEGTAPTRPRFAFNGLHGSDGKFSITIRDGSSVPSVIEFDAASDASLRVVIDAETRSFTIDGMPVFTPDLEWIELIPGKTYTINVTSGGFSSAYLSYYQRWW